VEAHVESHTLKEPAISAGVLVAETLSFGHTLERLVEFTLVVFVGVALAEYWEPRALLLAAGLMLVIRPLGVLLCLMGTPTSIPQRWLIGWFGIRGIGSLYYLAYAQTHGLAGEAATIVAKTVVSVVTLSILAHGVSVSPLVTLYERHLARPR
jgi:NhaP-type Na+/H+ or K+/H+ antiporter